MFVTIRFNENGGNGSVRLRAKSFSATKDLDNVPVFVLVPATGSTSVYRQDWVLAFSVSADTERI